jgi:CRP/FNR family transcriptional regulator, transcriptional activator FtrB
MSHSHAQLPEPATARPGLPAGPREALRGVPWLRAVPSATLDRLAGHAVLHRVPAGSMLFEQAETPAFAQILLAGSVELLAVGGADETRIELVYPVDLLLPAAVLTLQPYLLRARVMDEAHLLMIQAGIFRRAVTADHALCLAVLACQAAQFRRQVKQAKNVRLRSAEERVGAYLLRRHGSTPGLPARLLLNKRQIASELGMTRETFSRSLSNVARHGLAIDGDLVVVADPEAAHARFGLDPLIDGAEIIQPLATQGTEG